VAVIFAASITLGGGFVAELVVVTSGSVVVTGDVEEGGRDETAGPCGTDVEVSVMTRTTSRRGLDHIKR
jgi:hypothetical protein